MTLSLSQTLAHAVLFGLFGLFAAPATSADAAPRRISARDVAAAAARCGMPGLTVRRDGRRAFSVAQENAVTTVTFEQGPLSPERERQLEAEAEAAMRPWHCLQRWGRRHRATIGWAMPPVVVP